MVELFSIPGLVLIAVSSWMIGVATGLTLVWSFDTWKERDA